MRGVILRVALFTAFSVLVTSIVVTSLLDSNVHASSGYSVMFNDVAGLEAGDTVRIAGVEVGKISSVDLAGPHQSLARIDFSVDTSQHLTTTTQATIDFENLLGQRFLALLPGSTPGRPLRAGGTIPVSQTHPALDLTEVFDGFEPLFSALAPGQVNQLANSIIQVFQGESGTVSNLVQETAVVTENLADRQQVIDSLLNNLAGLLQVVGAHDAQLGQLIGSFDTLVRGLAGSKDQLAQAVDGLGSLNTQVGGLLGQAAPALHDDIVGLQSATATLAQDQNSLSGVLTGFPGILTALAKVQSTGSYLNVYICDLTINVDNPLDVSLIPGVPAPQAGDPVTLPSGTVASGAANTRTCT
jgi:phospholipid/cholesterol/gamma-HCH transport system substrate-binding protein